MSTAALEALLESTGAQGLEAQAVSMLDRYRGVILGVAAGNGLGLVVEGRSRQWIGESFPGGVREIPEKLREYAGTGDTARTAIHEWVQNHVPNVVLELPKNAPGHPWDDDVA